MPKKKIVTAAPPDEQIKQENPATEEAKAPHPNLRPPFSATNQPTREQKQQGWEKLRARRLLTQTIIKELIGEDESMPSGKLRDYVLKLISLAQRGNFKAIESVNTALEDQETNVNLTTNQPPALHIQMVASVPEFKQITEVQDEGQNGNDSSV